MSSAVQTTPVPNIAFRLRFLAISLALLALTSGTDSHAASDRAQRVTLLTRSWSFPCSEAPISTLTAQRTRGEFQNPGHSKSFTVIFSLELKHLPRERAILDIPGVLNVALRQHDPRDRNRQNYPAFKMQDGTVPVLEAILTLHSIEHPDWTNMTIGIPLAMLQQPMGRHQVVLSFSGVDWRLYVDGEKLDNDFPFGYPRWAPKGDWKLDGEFVSEATLHVPGISPTPKDAPTPRTAPTVQYWTPYGHNNWVGDVATIFHQGRYHIFYLYDRRHHQSKFGCGAHYFEHLSTTDFQTWTQHEAATPLDEQWECIGTGIPFVFNDRLHLSFGWHTTRVYPQEKTTLPAQWDYLKKYGQTGRFHRSTTPGVPAGATFSVSADGISRFQKTGVMFHPCENPSVYLTPDRKLRLLANYRSQGTWESDSVEGGWRCVNPSFPPGGDCTVYFRWGNFDYILGGFTGLWSKPAHEPDSGYVDLVRRGLEFYDGLSVPSISGISDGRFLMAGWIPIRGWGGPLILRELVQYPDGRIGSKWMPEVTPETGKPVTLAKKISGTEQFTAPDHSFLLVFQGSWQGAATGKLAVSFLPESEGQPGCELQLDIQEGRAQFAPTTSASFAPIQKTLREGGQPHQARDYAIENLKLPQNHLTVRLIVKRDEKLGGSIIDAELAEQRTLITFRPDLRVKTLAFRAEHAEFHHVELRPLQPLGAATVPAGDR